MEDNECKVSEVLELAGKSALPVKFDDGTEIIVDSYSGGTLPPEEVRLRITRGTEVDDVVAYGRAEPARQATAKVERLISFMLEHDLRKTLEDADGVTVATNWMQGQLDGREFLEQCLRDCGLREDAGGLGPVERAVVALNRNRVHLDRVRGLVIVQKDPGNAQSSDYGRGLANGLILALHVLEDCAGDPDFVEAPQEEVGT